MNDQMLYISCDGDSAGTSVGQAALANDEQGLMQAGQKIDAGQEVVKSWVLANGGQMITSGGDESNFKAPASAVENLESLRADYQFTTGLTLTVGVGSTISEANKALLSGKSRGKNQISQYEPIVEHEIQNSHQDVVASDGTPDPAAVPMAEADAQYTHGDDCKYCQEVPDHGHTDDCQYCNPSDGHSHTDDCKYCTAMTAEPTHDHMDDCQYCMAAEAGDHDHTDDCKYCAAHNGKPENVHTDDCQYCAQMPQQPQAGLASAAIITGELNNPQAPGQPNSEDMNAIDPSSMPLGDSMEDNVSRPDDFNGSLQESEESQQPAMQDVLQGNLDQHADQIAKEKVIALVGEALEGFKANKQILEKAKEQAPQLYSSTILMLKSMIEMAKMLGLKGETPEEQPQQPQQEQPQGDSPDPKASPSR